MYEKWDQFFYIFKKTIFRPINLSGKIKFGAVRVKVL